MHWPVFVIRARHHWPEFLWKHDISPFTDRCFQENTTSYHALTCVFIKTQHTTMHWKVFGWKICHITMDWPVCFIKNVTYYHALTDVFVITQHITMHWPSCFYVSKHITMHPPVFLWEQYILPCKNMTSDHALTSIFIKDRDITMHWPVFCFVKDNNIIQGNARWLYKSISYNHDRCVHQKTDDHTLTGTFIKDDRISLRTRDILPWTDQVVFINTWHITLDSPGFLWKHNELRCAGCSYMKQHITMH